MRRNEYPHLYQIISDSTDLATVEHEHQQIQLAQPIELEAKATCVVKEYNEEEDDDENTDNKQETKFQLGNINLNINITNKQSNSNHLSTSIMKYNPDEEDFASNDPYQIKKGHITKIDEATEKMIQEITKEVDNERKLEEKRKIQKEQL